MFNNFISNRTKCEFLLPNVMYSYLIFITEKNSGITLVLKSLSTILIPFFKALIQSPLLLQYFQIILFYYSSDRISPIYESHSPNQYGKTFSQDQPYRCLDYENYKEFDLFYQLFKPFKYIFFFKIFRKSWQSLLFAVDSALYTRSN